MLYDRPVRELIVDAVATMPGRFRRSDVVAWFQTHYPAVKPGTVTAHLSAATVNFRSRHHFANAAQDLLFQREDHTYERYDRTRHGQWDLHGQLIDGTAVVPSASTSRGPGASATDAGITSGHAFEIHAREVCSRAWGVPLGSAVVEIAPGCTHQFDLVSADGRIVGDAKWYKNLAVPAAKWSTIAEYVWLLQHLDAAERRFLVFGQDREVPERWLKRFAPLADDIEFWFLKDHDLTRMV